MEKKTTKKRAALFSIFYFIIATIVFGKIWTDSAYDTFQYDPAWGGGVSCLIIVLPMVLLSTIVLFLAIVYIPKYASVFVIAFVVLFALSTYIYYYHETGLPGPPWEYNQEYSDVITKMKGNSNQPDDYYKVYTYNENVSVYEGAFYGSYKKYSLLYEGVIIDGGLYITFEDGEQYLVHQG